MLVQDCKYVLDTTHDIAGEKIEDWIFAIIYIDDR